MSLRQLSIQWKITLLAGLCLLGIVTLLVGLSLYRMAQSSQQVKASSMQMLDEAAQSRIEAQGEVQALGIRQQFMDAYPDDSSTLFAGHLLGTVAPGHPRFTLVLPKALISTLVMRAAGRGDGHH